MSRDDICKKVYEIFVDVFERDDIEFTEETTASDVEEWDSLTHLSVISELEKKFNIAFTLDEISETKKVNVLINIIQRKLSDKEIM